LRGSIKSDIHKLAEIMRGDWQLPQEAQLQGQ
jgi:hypothetical protein